MLPVLFPSDGEGSLHDHTLTILDGSVNVSLSAFAGQVEIKMSTHATMEMSSHATMDMSSHATIAMSPGRSDDQCGGLLRVRRPVPRLQCTEGQCVTVKQMEYKFQIVLF